MAKTFWLKNNKVAFNNNKPIYCSYCPCGTANYYIYGRCGSTENTLSVEQADDPSTLSGGYVLDGPFQKAKCELYIVSKKTSYLADLTEKCSGNSCTSVLSWVETSGKDLDVYVEIMTDPSEVYGWGQANPGTYGHWYGDNTGTSGSEKISFNRTNLMTYCTSKGVTTVTVDLNAHWYSSVSDGKITITYTAGSTVTKKDITVTKQSTSKSKSDYMHVGTMVYNPFTDTFTITD